MTAAIAAKPYTNVTAFACVRLLALLARTTDITAPSATTMTGLQAMKKVRIYAHTQVSQRPRKARYAPAILAYLPSYIASTARLIAAVARAAQPKLKAHPTITVTVVITCCAGPL